MLSGKRERTILADGTTPDSEAHVPPNCRKSPTRFNNIKGEAVRNLGPPNEIYKLGCSPLQLFCIMHIKPRKFIIYDPLKIVRLYQITARACRCRKPVGYWQPSSRLIRDKRHALPPAIPSPSLGMSRRARTYGGLISYCIVSRASVT